MGRLGLSKRDFLYLALPAIILVLAFQFRPRIVDPVCGTSPDSCQASNVAWPDSLSTLFWNPKADLASDITQFTAGGIAFLTPVIYQGVLLLLKRATPYLALVSAGTDLVILIEATLFSASINEVVRLSVQRPRPFVYSDPARHGKDVSHYNSFYSGHTSFATVIMTTLFFILLGRRVPFNWTIGFGLLGLVLSFSTGCLRILAGRHFISDVVMGFIAGLCIAILVAKLHKKPLEAGNKYG
jgi:membrane-associated phospholipid phosphatase